LEIRIILSMENFPKCTFTGKPRMGQASRYIKDIHNRVADFASTRVTSRIFVKSSMFDLPSTNIPVIMVGPGTGIAPFVGFMEERELTSAERKSEEVPWHLFFGCRKRNSDFIYRETIEGY
jgi:NADPH-ferrihemoprotein reductase